MTARKKSTSGKNKSPVAKKSPKYGGKKAAETYAEPGAGRQHATKEQVAALFAVFLCCAQDRVRKAVGNADWSGGGDDEYPDDPMSGFLPDLARFLSEDTRQILREAFADGTSGAKAAHAMTKVVDRIWYPPPCPPRLDTLAALMALQFRVEREEFGL